MDFCSCPVIVDVIRLNMAFTLRHTFMLLLAVSIAMAVSTQFEAYIALLMTMVLASPVVFFFPDTMRRPFFYGGLAGVVLGFVLSYFVLSAVFMQHPREPIVYGPRVGQMQPPLVQRNLQQKLNPFIVTLGFVIGATSGLVLSRNIPNAG